MTQQPYENREVLRQRAATEARDGWQHEGIARLNTIGYAVNTLGRNAQTVRIEVSKEDAAYRKTIEEAATQARVNAEATQTGEQKTTVVYDQAPVVPQLSANPQNTGEFAISTELAKARVDQVHADAGNQDQNRIDHYA